jgi:hypothetical protein
MKASCEDWGPNGPADRNPGRNPADPNQHRYSVPPPSAGSSACWAHRLSTWDQARITAQGVAALVAEHLGADNVRRYLTYGQDEGSVDVMVQLRGADRRDMFVVGVASPDQAGQEYHGFTELDCARMKGQGGRRGGRLWCEDLANGGVTFVELTPYGFSDDNTEGRTLMGLAAEPDGRLAWSTDPSVNEAGRDINVRLMAG